MSSWLVRRGNKTMGPVTVDFLKQKAASGELLPTDEIKQPGKTDWVACGTVQGLFPKTGARSSAVHRGARVAAPPPPAPVASPHSGGDVGSPELPGDKVAADEDDDFYATLSTRPAAAGVGSRPAAPRPIVSASYSGFLPRLAAYLLDALIIGCIMLLPGIVIGILAVVVAPVSGPMIANLVLQLLTIIVTAAYFIGLESSAKQATWGKQIVGLRVTGIRGDRLTVGKAIGRYASKCLSYLTGGLIFLLPLFTKRRQAMHDLMAATVVVDDDA